MNDKKYRAIIATPGPNSNGDYFPRKVLEKAAETSIGKPVKMGLDANAPVIGKIVDSAVVNGNLEVVVKLKDWTPKAGDWLGYIFNISKIECSECHRIFESEVLDLCEHLKKKRTDQADLNKKDISVSGAHEISLDARLEYLAVYPLGTKSADPNCKILGEESRCPKSRCPKCGAHLTDDGLCWANCEGE